METVPVKFPRQEFKTQVADKELTIETGKFAQQANGSVLARYGDTVVLATAVLADKPRDDVSYFPLMVDYQEKLYAAGKIKGSRFIKREGKPSDEAVLTSRVIDRSIRPLFPQHITNDIQVVVDVLSFDNENDSDVLAIVAASAALAISDIPYGPVMGAVRVGLINKEFVINPTFEARKDSSLDLILAAAKEKVVMIEAGAREVSEEDMQKAIDFGKKEINKLCSFIENIVKEIGLAKKDFPKPELSEEIKKEIAALAVDKVNDILYGQPTLIRKKLIHDLNDEVVAAMVEKHGEDDKDLYNDYFDELSQGIVRDNILQQEKRIGGRGLKEIRPLETGCQILPRTHGSGYFKRGETQVLTMTTLGAPSQEQIIDDMEIEQKKRFMHHYNFPPYSVGEVSPLRGPSRRDIGHGALAERALEAVIPGKEEFQYTIRLVSEVFESNGSSSMASVCGSSLSLMDAGVPIKAPVAGIAMGLASDGKNYRVLTDLQDLEDSEGGMDFKVAGTKDGITAVQMDTKSAGLTDEMVTETFHDAKEARLKILDKMAEAIAHPRPDLSPYAPRIISFKINPEKIGIVIGPGGKMINEIIDATGVEIDIEDDGTVMVTSAKAEALNQAVDRIKLLTKEAKIGEVYDGEVVKLMDFGAFVEIFSGTDGLIHISKMGMGKGRVNKVTDVLKTGDKVQVKVLEITPEGKINLGLLKKL